MFSYVAWWVWLLLAVLVIGPKVYLWIRSVTRS